MIQAGLGTKIELAVHRTLNTILNGTQRQAHKDVPQTWAQAMSIRNARMLKTLAGRTQTFTVLEHERLDPLDSEHATWRIRFSGKGDPGFIPGDMVYLRYQNMAEQVGRVLELLGASGEEQVQFKTASSKYNPGWLEQASLRDALTHAVELQEAAPAMLRYYGMDEVLKHNKSMDDLHRRYHKNAARAGYFSARHPKLDYKRVSLASLLADGGRPVPKPAEFLGLQSRIFPRCYTMSDFQQKSPELFEFEITVSQAEKEMLLADGSLFWAPARSSNFLGQVSPGQVVEGWLLPEPHHFPYTLNRETECIVICTGSGISALLALLRTQRQARGIHLIYGIRSWRKKALYAAELEGYLREGRISRLDAISSRPEPGEGEARRVQHFVWNSRDEIAAAIDRGAHIYLCGRLSMGEETAITIADILVERGKANTQTEGLAILEGWHQEMRIQAAVSGM